MSGTSAMAAVERAGAAPPVLRRRAPLARALAVAIAAVALFACYLRQSRTVAVGSDGASQALQAWDLLHGNPLLHGWWVTDVSFYTTELPQYALLELARGLTADVIHVAGAMTYTLLVLAAALLARGRARGDRRRDPGADRGRDHARAAARAGHADARARRPTTPAPASRSCSSSCSSTGPAISRGHDPAEPAGTSPCLSGSAWPGPPWRTR